MPRLPSRPLLLLLALSALVLTAGCATYDSLYAFRPRPVVSTVNDAQTGDPAARVLSAAIGVRNASDTVPAGIEVRVRVENLDVDEVLLREADLRLVTGDLRELRAAPDQSAAELRVSRNDAGELTTLFVFPDGADADDLDLTGLDLRWTLHLDGRRVTGSATFQRHAATYYHAVDPWSGGYYYGGYYGHRHRHYSSFGFRYGYW